MSGPEIRDGSAFEIRIDDRGSDVGLPADGRRVAEPVGDGPHDGGDGALAARRPLGEGDRRDERPAPRSEVLGAELVAEVRLHVLVQRAARQVAEPAPVLVPEEPAAARHGEQLADSRRELVVHERRPHLRLALAHELEPDALAAHLNMPLPERGDAERAGRTRMAVAPDAKPAEVDEAKRDRADPVAVELVLVEVVDHRAAQLRQLLAEADEALELRALLLGAEIGVVDVLLPPGGVVAGRLELRARTRGDPDVLPGRRD